MPGYISNTDNGPIQETRDARDVIKGITNSGHFAQKLFRVKIARNLE